ncbi:helix-turn-helix domain-containing protein [Actinoalloteichus spitiensis]|uniref:helix-turn-helix domain-containing protein n=1 Tax=Actinoalloteichus spitiensis TaxID=252394 RepID=UPI000370541D|nr:helix-turn-helix transcriptional regulator [Actinoalloteichus spitiensis]
MAPSSPTVASWELGLRLRERRELMGLTAQAVAKRSGCTQGYLSEVERGKTKIAEERLAALTEIYEFHRDEAEELAALRRDANQRPWWNSYSALFSDDLLRFFGYEHGAESCRAYDGGLVPGLLQTEDYARAVIRGGGPNIRLAEVDRRVEARMLRKQRLTGPSPIHYTAVINEAVLRQHVGGPRVLADQLTYLVDMIESCPDTLDLRVVPFTADAYHALGGSTFYLLDFASSRLPTLVWQETVTSTDLIDHYMRVREYDLAYSQAAALALSAADSLALIRLIAKELL